MTLDAPMLAFIADHPMTKITISYDPFRDSCRWTAIAYVWRRDGDTQTEAIDRLRDLIAARTIKVLPVMPEGCQWVREPPSVEWYPVKQSDADALPATRGALPIFGTPPPYSIVFDWGTGRECLYVPDRLIRWVPEDDGSVRCEREPVLDSTPSEPLPAPARNFRCVVEPVFDETEQS